MFCGHQCPNICNIRKFCGNIYLVLEMQQRRVRPKENARTCTRARTHTHTHIHTHTHKHLHTKTHTYTHTHTYIYIYTHTHTHIHVSGLCQGLVRSTDVSKNYNAFNFRIKQCTRLFWVLWQKADLSKRR